MSAYHADPEFSLKLWPDFLQPLLPGGRNFGVLLFALVLLAWMLGQWFAP